MSFHFQNAYSEHHMFRNDIRLRTQRIFACLHCKPGPTLCHHTNATVLEIPSVNLPSLHVSALSPRLACAFALASSIRFCSNYLHTLHSDIPRAVHTATVINSMAQPMANASAEGDGAGNVTYCRHFYVTNNVASASTDPASAPEPASSTTWRDTQQDIQVRVNGDKTASSCRSAFAAVSQGEVQANPPCQRTCANLSAASSRDGRYGIGMEMRVLLTQKPYTHLYAYPPDGPRR